MIHADHIDLLWYRRQHVLWRPSAAPHSYRVPGLRGARSHFRRLAQRAGFQRSGPEGQTCSEAASGPGLLHSRFTPAGAPTWPNGFDLAPWAVYDEMARENTPDPPLHAARPNGYWIARIAVTDPDRYGSYAKALPAIVERFGGCFLVAGGRSRGRGKAAQRCNRFPRLRDGPRLLAFRGVRRGGTLARRRGGGRGRHC